MALAVLQGTIGNREFLLDTRSRPTVRLGTCAMKFCGYETGDFFDEMFGENGQPRAAARPLARNIESLPDGELVNRQQAAEQGRLFYERNFDLSRSLADDGWRSTSSQSAKDENTFSVMSGSCSGPRSRIRWYAGYGFARFDGSSSCNRSA